MSDKNIEDSFSILIKEAIELRVFTRFLEVWQSCLLDILFTSCEHHTEQKSTHLSQINVLRYIILFLDLLN